MQDYTFPKGYGTENGHLIREVEVEAVDAQGITYTNIETEYVCFYGVLVRDVVFGDDPTCTIVVRRAKDIHDKYNLPLATIYSAQKFRSEAARLGLSETSTRADRLRLYVLASIHLWTRTRPA